MHIHTYIIVYKPEEFIKSDVLVNGNFYLLGAVEC